MEKCMGITVLKPRWQTWENVCLQLAFSQSIQQKIMATALGKTVTAVSKKIKSLGLRSAPFLQEQQEKTQPPSRTDKTPQDLKRMLEILHAHAPLGCFQEGCLALQKGYWSQSEPIPNQDENQRVCMGWLKQDQAAYSFAKPLDFIHSPNPIGPEIESIKIPGEPLYVPLYHVERWANSAGFHKMKGPLQQRGLSYWKNGSYFSQAQLLMHVNQRRFEQSLRPIVLREEEKESPA